jgi:hypothetical protein
VLSAGNTPGVWPWKGTPRGTALTIRWREGEGRRIIRFGASDMARLTQFKIGWCMIAIAIVGYFCAFPELAVLLGIFVASLLFVSPVLVAPYLAHCFLLRSHGPADPRP